MTSTLYFYKLPINLLDKNFILENLETYLATLTPITKSSFQYQRFEMEKTIKLNLSQDYQTYNGLIRYNYLKITQLNANNTTSIYYYFIKKARQVSESTIAFDLVMDTLNTFKFKTTFQGGQDYTLSDKTLITREHKDRFGNLKMIIGQKASIKKSLRKPTYYYFPLVDRELIISELSHGSEEVVYNYLLAGGSPLTPIGFNIYLYDKQTGKRNTEYTLLANRLTLTIATSEEYEEDSIDIYVESVRPRNNHGIIVYDTISFIKSKNENMIIEFVGSMTNDSYNQKRDVFTSFFDTFNVRTFEYIRPRKIYQYQEGIESIIFKNSENQLLDEDETIGWYVAFSSANAVVQSDTDTSARYVNPVNVKFYSDVGYTLETSVKTIRRYRATEVPQVADNEEFIFITKEMLGVDGYIEINGVQYTASGIGNNWQECYCLEKVNNNDSTFRRFGLICRTEQFFTRQWLDIKVDVPFEYVDFYGVKSVDMYVGWTLQLSQVEKTATIDINSGSSSSTLTSPEFKGIDLTDPKLIKIINFPYCPNELLVGRYTYDSVPSGMVVGANSFELQKAQDNGFSRIIKFNHSPYKDILLNNEYFADISKREERNIIYESKLFHSDYYLPKFVYDSFSFMFRLEDMDEEQALEAFFPNEFSVQYVCSGNVQSKFAFIFNDYVCKRELQDYNNVLVVERNNEKALFNNAYINYIRSGGFRFDTKNADMQKMMNGITIPLAGLASGAGVGAMMGATSTPGPLKIAGAITGAIVGMATRTITAIHSAQQNDRQIAQKLLSASQQGTNVSTSEDIDILKAYSNNKAKLCFYEVSSYLKNALWDLFHYFGYRCNEYKIPQTNTRCNFNFIQADIVFKDFTFNDDVARDIIAKWNEGVTFMHYDNSLGYDFNQEYENFETNIL